MTWICVAALVHHKMVYIKSTWDISHIKCNIYMIVQQIFLCVHKELQICLGQALHFAVVGYKLNLLHITDMQSEQKLALRKLTNV